MKSAPRSLWGCFRICLESDRGVKKERVATRAWVGHRLNLQSAKGQVPPLTVQTVKLGRMTALRKDTGGVPGIVLEKFSGA